MSSMLQRYNGENFPKVDGLRFSLPFLRFTFLLKISPDVHFLLAEFNLQMQQNSD